MIAFTSHFYGQNPVTVLDWKISDIEEWHKKAVKVHNKLWSSDKEKT